MGDVSLDQLFGARETSNLSTSTEKRMSTPGLRARDAVENLAFYIVRVSGMEQRQGKLETQREIYYKELAHVIMKAETVSMQFQSEGLRTRGANGVNFSLSLNPQAGEKLCPRFEGVQEDRENSFLLNLLFYSGRQWIG